MGIWDFHVKTPLHNEGGLLMAELFSELDQIDNLEDFKVYRSKLIKKSAFWKQRVLLLKKKGGYKSNKDLAEACCVTVPTVRNWLAGIVPRSRDNFIKIGFAEKSNLEQMDNLLQRYGYQALYSKNYEDAVYKFVLQNKDSLPECGYRYCRKIIEMIKDDVENEQDAMNVPTTNLDERLGGMRDVPELTTFICENAEIFKSRYSDFYDYVKFFVSENRLNEGSKDTINKLAEIQGWTSSMKQAIYDIKNECWFPTRLKVISIGVHLNMTIEELNHMLHLAKMGPLCPQSPFESVIIFSLRDAALNDMIHRDGGIELCLSVRNLLEKFDDFDFIGDFMNDLPTEDDQG